MKDIDLESLHENKNKKKNHSDLKYNNITQERRSREGSGKINVQQFMLSKHIKTTKNSDEGSSKQEGDSHRQHVVLNKEGMPLNQSFSIKNIIQNQIEQSEVESLMMNKQIQGQHMISNQR